MMEAQFVLDHCVVAQGERQVTRRDLPQTLCSLTDRMKRRQICPSWARFKPCSALTYGHLAYALRLWECRALIDGESTILYKLTAFSDFGCRCWGESLTRFGAWSFASCADGLGNSECRMSSLREALKFQATI
jgi:hypothetical protein